MQITTSWGLGVIRISGYHLLLGRYHSLNIFPGHVWTAAGKGEASSWFCHWCIPTLRAVPFTLHTLSKCSLGISQESFLSNVLSTLVNGLLTSELTTALMSFFLPNCVNKNPVRYQTNNSVFKTQKLWKHLGFYWSLYKLFFF